MWSRWGAVAALVAGAVLVGAPLAAHADGPVELNGAYVVDTVGAITGQETQVQTALDDLYDQTSYQLFVVYVSTFDNPSDRLDWASETAKLNNLGENDILLSVALDDRLYSLTTDGNFPLTDDQLSAVDVAIEGKLRDNDWAGAAITGADTLIEQANAPVVTDPTTPDTDGDDSASGGIPILPILGGVVVIGGGVFLFSRIRKRSKDGQVTALPDQMTQKELDTRAGSLLVQLDDSLKTSEQELGFAVAQFGDEATKDFTNVLASAKAKVAEAFTLKQKLDDAQPDSDAEKREWTTRIIQLCEAADAELDSQADAFDDLRQLEKNAPEALTQVQADATAARARITAAAATLEQLQGRYAASAVSPVADNVVQATRLLDFADTASAKAKTAIDAGDASTAAVAVRTAQSSVGQANQLFAAVDTLAGDLAEASSKLDAAIADTTQDIAAARSLPADPGLSPAIAAAESALATVTATQGDPLANLARIEQANASLDTVFTGVRDKQQQVARATAQLDASITAARGQITSAAEYISTRRGGIGESARTRVSEADRHLQQAIALSATDPVAALAEAQRATTLASSAFELAQSDVSNYQSFNNDSSYGYQSSQGSADLGGLLGGLIGGMLGSGGGSSRSSYRPSSNYRSGSRSGSFGGSSRSSSRSVGRSSGGRRSRGGRF